MTNESPTVAASDLKKFPRPVQTVLKEAINGHGVAYRLLDGGHIRLFCGDRSVVPIKVAAQRPAEHTLRVLLPWLEKNIPAWTQRKEVSVDQLDALAQVINGDSSPAPTGGAVAEEEPVEPTSSDDPPEGWSEWKFGFITNGEIYRCNYPDCDFERPGATGLHFHEQKKHKMTPEQVSNQSRSAAEMRALQRAQRKAMQKEAARVVAESFGWVVVDGDAKTVDGMQKEIERLTAQVEKLTKENGDLEARVALIRESLKA
jgi:hypothetical protein